jgi:hypothetical protein
MISIDWQQVIGALLVGVSGIGGIAWGGKLLWAKWKALPASKLTPFAERSADAPAPSGAVEWVEDICTAMGSASAESVLIALRDGASRDDARSRRIGELERLSVEAKP